MPGTEGVPPSKAEIAELRGLALSQLQALDNGERRVVSVILFPPYFHLSYICRYLKVLHVNFSIKGCRHIDIYEVIM